MDCFGQVEGPGERLGLVLGALGFFVPEGCEEARCADSEVFPRRLPQPLYFPATSRARPSAREKTTSARRSRTAG